MFRTQSQNCGGVGELKCVGYLDNMDGISNVWVVRRFEFYGFELSLHTWVLPGGLRHCGRVALHETIRDN